MQHRTLECFEKRIIGLNGQIPHGAVGNDETELVDRIGWVRYQDHIPRPGDRLCQVGETFLGTNCDNGLGFWIKCHAEPFPVVRRQRPTQAGNATRVGIAMGARVLHRLHQLLDDMRRGWKIGIAHTEVDDICTCRTRRRLHCIHFGENVGRQPPDAVELGIHGTCPG